MRSSKFKITLLCFGLTVFSLSYAFTSKEATQENEVTLLNELNTILAAAQQYTADTGEVLPITDDTKIEYGYLKIDNLIKNPGLANWKGPYINYKDDWRGKEQYLAHPVYSAVQIQAKQQGEWARGSSANGCRQSSEACDIAACIWSVPEDLIRKVNFKVDGVMKETDKDFDGLVRYDGSIVCLKGGSYPPEKSPVK